MRQMPQGQWVPFEGFSAIHEHRPTPRSTAARSQSRGDGRYDDIDFVEVRLAGMAPRHASKASQSGKRQVDAPRAIGPSATGCAVQVFALVTTLWLAACAGGASPAAGAAATRASTPAVGTSPPVGQALFTAPPTASPTIATASAPMTPAPTHSVTLSVGSPVSRGRTATASAQTSAAASCTITVTYASGPSSAQGLAPKSADGSGTVSWSWTVGTQTTRGSWPVDVRCTSRDGQTASARQLIVVQ